MAVNHTHDSSEQAACCHHHSPVPQTSLKSKRSPLEPGQELSRFYIAQMDCPVEEQLIRSKLESKAGVLALDFNLMQRSLEVVHETGLQAQIEDDLQELGMAPQRLSADSRAVVPVMRSDSVWRIALAVTLALVAEGLGWWGVSDWWALLVAGLALILTGPAVYKKGLIALKNRNLNINALMSIAVTGAILIGSWAEAAMVMSLFALAELIEARSLDRVRHAVDGLLQLAPEQVEVLDEQGHWHWQPAQAVAVGSVVKVLPGARIGLDGIVASGHSVVNQAPITGESAPVDKQAGDWVFAGSVNGFGELQFTTHGMYDDNLLVRIALAVQNAQQAQAPVQRFVDQFARVYTPVVTGLALALALLGPWLFGGAWLDWVYKALVLLVIACPCALVISTPVAVVSALTKAAKMGLLIKGGVYLEQARHLQYLALDKTGTVTVGQPQLQHHWVASDIDQNHVFAIARSLAQRSDHPASMAVATGLARYPVAPVSIDTFQAEPGAGVWAQIDSESWRLGRLNWVQASATGALPEAMQQWITAQQANGATLVFLGVRQQIKAAFALVDQVKPDAILALEALARLGVRVEMLSGDNSAAVQHIAQQLPLTHAYGDLLPQDKQRILTERGKGGVTGMVGDGINDAPALAQAHIGFAMGALGADMAIETADVAIMNDDLRKIPQLMQLSQRLHRILVQNISVALGIKAVFLLMALTGSVTMWMAVFADVGASLLVIANSLRLLKTRLSA